MMAAGRLYLVATPIGNLGDITLRALETLRSVDLIASEDTRKTGFLLKHFDIHKPQIAFHEHNEERAGGAHHGSAGRRQVGGSRHGGRHARHLGPRLHRRAPDRGRHRGDDDPGATALVMAVVLSGLPVHSFTYRGFPPHKSGRRRRSLEIDRESPHTLIFYESPYRLDDLLADALQVYGDRDAAVAHELTKLHESIRRGRLSELLANLEENPKGEYVVLIAGKDVE